MHLTMATSMADSDLSSEKECIPRKWSQLQVCCSNCGLARKADIVFYLQRHSQNQRRQNSGATGVYKAQIAVPRDLALWVGARSGIKPGNPGAQQGTVACARQTRRSEQAGGDAYAANSTLDKRLSDLGFGKGELRAGMSF